MNLTKREQAVILLGDLFRFHSRLAVADVLSTAQQHGISTRTMQRVAATVGIRTIRNGPHGAFWEIAA